MSHARGQDIPQRRRAAVVALQRRQIREGLCLAAAEKGYERTTIADIVREAHVSKSTFYELFSDKHDVFLELLDQTFAALDEALVGAVGAAADAPLADRVAGLVSAYVECLETYPPYLTVLAMSELVITPAARAVSRRRRNEFRDLLATTHAQWSADFDLAPLDDTLIDLALGGMHTVVTQTTEPDSQHTLSELVPRLTDFWLRLLTVARPDTSPTAPGTRADPR